MAVGRHRMFLSVAMAFAASVGAGEAMRQGETVGGANSPPPSPPPKIALKTRELTVGAFSVRVPTGVYKAPAGGAPAYSVPGPIVSFKGPDGAWRGHGYLETLPRLVSFAGKLRDASAELLYTFEGGETYNVSLSVGEGALLIEEKSALGPRNLFVFDCYYGGWLPSAAFAIDRQAANHAFLYLPCYYDKPEVTIEPANKAPSRPGGVAVLSADPARRDIAGFWCRDISSWENPDAMGIQLWQRRQLPGDPASRHFLGPETKSDSTPNPRTAPLLGRSLYEGHVTIEFALGVGSRKLGFAVVAEPSRKDQIPEALKTVVRENR